MPRGTALRRWRWAIVATALALIGAPAVATATPPAALQLRLIGAWPAEQQLLSLPPPNVTATFAEHVLPAVSWMTVTRHGREVDGTTSFPEDGDWMSFTPREPLPSGHYTVQAHAVSRSAPPQTGDAHWTFDVDRSRVSYATVVEAAPPLGVRPVTTYGWPRVYKVRGYHRDAVEAEFNGPSSSADVVLASRPGGRLRPGHYLASLSGTDPDRPWIDLLSFGLQSPLRLAHVWLRDIASSTNGRLRRLWLEFSVDVPGGGVRGRIVYNERAQANVQPVPSELDIAHVYPHRSERVVVPWWNHTGRTVKVPRLQLAASTGVSVLADRCSGTRVRAYATCNVLLSVRAPRPGPVRARLGTAAHPSLLELRGNAYAGATWLRFTLRRHGATRTFVFRPGRDFALTLYDRAVGVRILPRDKPWFWAFQIAGGSTRPWHSGQRLPLSDSARSSGRRALFSLGSEDWMCESPRGSATIIHNDVDRAAGLVRQLRLTFDARCAHGGRVTGSFGYLTR